jgi:Zn-dependent oligopeptidase
MTMQELALEIIDSIKSKLHVNGSLSIGYTNNDIKDFIKRGLEVNRVNKKDIETLKNAISELISKYEYFETMNTPDYIRIMFNANKWLALRK